MTDSFLDIALKPNQDGIYDAYIDPETGDLAVTSGLETAILVSWFTDGRADESEVRDVMKRRGWIGDPYCDVEGGLGCLLWLYQQARLNGGTERDVYFEIVKTMKWLTRENLATHYEVTTVPVFKDGGLKIVLRIFFSDGGSSDYAWNVWLATAQGRLK